MQLKCHLSHFAKRKPTTPQGSLALVRALQATGDGDGARAQLRKASTCSRIITDSGLPRGALKLEVTEGDIMRDTAKAASVPDFIKKPFMRGAKC